MGEDPAPEAQQLVPSAAVSSQSGVEKKVAEDPVPEVQQPVSSTAVSSQGGDKRKAAEDPALDTDFAKGSKVPESQDAAKPIQGPMSEKAKSKPAAKGTMSENKRRKKEWMSEKYPSKAASVVQNRSPGYVSQTPPPRKGAVSRGSSSKQVEKAFSPLPCARPLPSSP